MKARWLIVIVVTLLFISSIFLVSADRKPSLRDLITAIQAEIVEIWTAIAGLQTQIDNLQGETTCPSDMVEVVGFCIDKDENTANYWAESLEICVNEGKRFCSPSEWSGACITSPPELINMEGNWEWVDDFAFTSDGSRWGYLMGNPTCYDFGPGLPDWTIESFRCCKYL